MFFTGEYMPLYDAEGNDIIHIPICSLTASLYRPSGAYDSYYLYDVNYPPEGIESLVRLNELISDYPKPLVSKDLDGRYFTTGVDNRRFAAVDNSIEYSIGSITGDAISGRDEQNGIIVLRLDGNGARYMLTAFSGYVDVSGERRYQIFVTQATYDCIVHCPLEVETTTSKEPAKNVIRKFMVNPKNFFSLEATPQLDWTFKTNIKVLLENGEVITPSPSSFSATPTNSDVTNLVLNDIENDYFNYEISYSRPEFLYGDWEIVLSSFEDPSISASIYLKAIPIYDDVYTPGTGQGEPSTSGGGGGNFGINPDTGQPEVSDNVATDLPGFGDNLPSTEPEVANAGMFTHYVCNNIKVAEFADWLWADNLGQAIMRDFASVFYGSPIESVISLMSYPFNVGAYAQTQTQSIRLGYNDTGVIASALTRTGIKIDWGTIQLTEFWGNFLDYAPHTKIELYLPWCTGFVPIDPHEVLPGSIQVITTIELAKGTCVHSIINHKGAVIGIHSGICGKQIPVTATDFSGKYVSMVTAAVSGVVAGTLAVGGTIAGAAAGGAAASRVAGAGGSASAQFAARNAAETATSEPYMRGAGRAANSALNNSRASFRTPPTVQRNGSFSDAGAGMGIQYPYLIISRPEQSVPSQYGHHYGYPSNIYASLSQLKGYTEIGEIHLDGITATDAEVDELDAILKGGVIF